MDKEFQLFQNFYLKKVQLKQKWLAHKRFTGIEICATEIDELIDYYEGDLATVDFHLQTLVVKNQNFQDVVLPGWTNGYQPYILLDVNLNVFKYLDQDDVEAVALTCKALYRTVQKWRPFINGVCIKNFKKRLKRQKKSPEPEFVDLNDESVKSTILSIDKELDFLVENFQTRKPIYKDPFAIARGEIKF